MSFTERYLNRHILFEAAPGILFFVTYQIAGLIWATAIVIASAIAVSALGFAIERRFPVFPTITVALVVILGGLTIVFDNDLFIKIKPTIGKCLFASFLASGLVMRRGILERALHGQIYLTSKGWDVLTSRWIVFALVLATTNELVWRNASTDSWVTIHALITPLSIVGYIVITRLTAPAYWDEPNPPPSC